MDGDGCNIWLDLDPRCLGCQSKLYEIADCDYFVRLVLTIKSSMKDKLGGCTLQPLCFPRLAKHFLATEKFVESSKYMCRHKVYNFIASTSW